MSFKTKVLGLSVTGLAVTNVIVIAILLLQKSELHEQTSAEVDLLGQQECSKIAADVYMLLRVAHENLLKEVESGQNVARHVLDATGARVAGPRNAHLERRRSVHRSSRGR